MSEAPTCRTCAHWSPYMPGLGECLEYVKRRQAAWAAADDAAAFREAWPAIPAHDTPDIHTCEKHEADDGDAP